MTDEQAKEIKRRIRWRIVEAAFENALQYDAAVEKLYKGTSTPEDEDELKDIIDMYDELRRDWYTNTGENPTELDAIVRVRMRNYYIKHRGDRR